MGHVFKAILSPVTNLFKGPDTPQSAQLPSYQTAGGDTVRNMSQDVATRDQQMQQRAAAAGAERTDNQADLLGNVRPVKKRAAATQLLG